MRWIPRESTAPRSSRDCWCSSSLSIWLTGGFDHAPRPGNQSAPPAEGLLADVHFPADLLHRLCALSDAWALWLLGAACASPHFPAGFFPLLDCCIPRIAFVEAVEVQQAVCIPSSVSSAYSIDIPHRLCPHHGKQNHHDAVPGWVEALVPRIGQLWDIDPANRYWRDERDISVAANETGTTSCPSGKISLVVETNKDSTTLFS